MPVTIREFASAAAAAEALAATVAAILAQAIRQRGAAVLAVAGGRTPVPFLSALFGVELDWARVTLVPTDDRWVPADSPDSNLGLLTALSTNRPAAQVHLVPLAAGLSPPEAEAAAAADRLAGLTDPFDAVILGMGDDGHVASLFPGHPLSATDGGACVAGTAPVPPYRRISLTLDRLLKSRSLFLLIGGGCKRRLFDKARTDEGCDLPVSAVMRRSAVPLDVFWHDDR